MNSRPAATRSDANRITLSLKRDDVAILVDALQSIIMYEREFDPPAVEEYERLEARLAKRLQSHDTTPFRSGGVA